MPEKEVNWKENIVGKIAKRQQIWKFTYNQILISAKFYSIMLSFTTMKIGIFQVRFIMFPLVEFPKICWTVKLICALSSAFWFKKIHDQIWGRGRKDKIANSKETAFVTPIFFSF